MRLVAWIGVQLENGKGTSGDWDGLATVKRRWIDFD